MHPRLRLALDLVVDAEARRRWVEMRRLRRLPRLTVGETNLLDRPTRFVDAGNFLFMYRQIFEQEVYRFRAKRPNPRVLDCGANLGLAILYWKRLFPAARIVAFEPDPQVFQLLEWNCASFSLRDVELHREAVWTANGDERFWCEGSDSGRLLASAGPLARGAESVVRTTRLRDHLDAEPVDLLKLDVEGAEAALLEDCADRLGAVDHLFVEYHSFRERPQRLNRILAILDAAGFRVHVQPELVALHPFVDRLDSGGMDQRLNLFAYRE